MNENLGLVRYGATILGTNLLSFIGYCRYGQYEDKRDLLDQVTENTVSKCQEKCGATKNCVAFAYKEDATNENCYLYGNGPYTYGTGREDTKCYIMPPGIVLSLYAYNDYY